jgi:hypothetical protein
VRKSADQGLTWTTVDDLTNARASRIHFVPGTNGGLFTVGYRVSGSGANTTYAWLVRRSRDAGATWNAVHIYAGSGNVGARAITSDSQGTIYVAGWGTPEAVKKSDDGGTTWQTIHTNPQGTVVSDMKLDAAGNLYLAAGSVLRRDSAGVWEDIGPAPDSGSAGALAVDPSGNILVVGSLQDPNPESPVTLVVQQFAVVLPPLKIAPSGGALLVSWPVAVTGTLEATTSLESPDWQPVATSPVIDGDEQTATVDVTGATQFFRLHKP